MGKILILFIALFTQYLRADVYEYGNVVIGGGGFVSAVVASPIEENIFYARTDVGGLYRWDEQTQSWIPLLDWLSDDERGLLGVEAVAVDPVVKGKVYIMAGTIYWNQANDGIGKSAFLKSEDYGKTWKKIYVWDDNVKYFNVNGNGMGRGAGERLAIDPANPNIIFYGSRNKGLWKSVDNGETWEKVESFPIDTTWNGCGISFVAFDPSTKKDGYTSRIYVGVFRAGDNFFVSEDGGQTWEVVPNRPEPTYDPINDDITSGTKIMRLMSQRIAITPDGEHVFVTFGNGAGPHTMQWDEGWGPINDWFNRGAVYRYDVNTKTWTNISPQNFINPSGEAWQEEDTYIGCYSGIAIDPNNPDNIVVSSINSWRGPQYWQIDGKWKDCWGDNIFVTQDGGKTWAPAFRYVWVDGGQVPKRLLDENGFPWIIGNTIHWIGSVCMDPFNPKRVFVTSGNGIFMTDNIFNYQINGNDIDQNTVWKFCVKGIEETVPLDLVSIPGGPVLSVIGDYDGFIHDDIFKPSVYGQFKCDVSGEKVTLGTNTSIAFAPKSGLLARVHKKRTVSLQYNDVPVGPIAFSTDTGKTWSVETYVSNPPAGLKGGYVALSCDGEVALWMPEQTTTMYRYQNASWSEVSGINFNSKPVADWENPDKFYIFNNKDGYVYVSNDKGISFEKGGYVGESNFKIIRTVPGHEGHLWVPIGKIDENGQKIGALMRSVDGGKTFTKIENIEYCEAVGIGKESPYIDNAYPSIFIVGQVNGKFSIYRSDDEGATWKDVGDPEHQYGGLANGEFIIGDKNYFGLFYMSTAGRGIVYGRLVDTTVVSVRDDIISNNFLSKDGYSISVAPNPISKTKRHFKIDVKCPIGNENNCLVKLYDVRGYNIGVCKINEVNNALIDPFLKPGIYKIAIVKNNSVKAIFTFTLVE